MKKDADCFCPICGSPVTRVIEMAAEDCDVESDCTSEYFVHKGKKLIKIIGPTPTDADMRKVLKTKKQQN